MSLQTRRKPWYFGPFHAFLKRFFNPLIRRFAGKSRTPFAIVYHVGRRSGKTYETPIIVMPLYGGFVVTLTYGPNVDWYKNIQAAGHFTLLWHNQEYHIASLQPLDTQMALAAFSQPFRFILKLRNERHFLKAIVQ
jgi:deazaflavin-dependent oxidoreductase (nitroreductase family)